MSTESQLWLLKIELIVYSVVGFMIIRMKNDITEFMEIRQGNRYNINFKMFLYGETKVKQLM